MLFSNHFVLKYFALIPAFWNLFSAIWNLHYCWKPFRFQEVKFSIKHISKRVSVFSKWYIFVKVAANKSNQKSRSILLCLSSCFIFRTHERDTATEKEFDIAIQKTLDYVLPQRSKQSTKWTTKVANINKYVNCYKVMKLLWKNHFV